MITHRPSHKSSKWQMTLYVALLAITIACMVALSRCDKPIPTSAGKPSGGDTIDVAIEYSPIAYYTFGDTLGGYHYDMLKLVSRVAHRPIKFHPIVTLQKGLEGLENGTYHVLVAQFPTTAQNRERFCFTQPVFIDQQVLVQRTGHAVHSQLELAGDTVHVVKSSPMVERIAGLSREIGDTIHVVTDDTYGPEQLVMMVAAGDIKYAVVNKSIAQLMAKRLTGIDTSIGISLSQFQAWALEKNNTALRDSLNTWLNKIDKTLITRLQERYFRNAM